MDESDKTQDAATQPPAADVPAESRKLSHGFFGNLRRRGTEWVAGALGRLVDDPVTDAEADGTTAGEATGEHDEARQTNVRRLGVLHGVTEKLRGAADTFVAAKLDEIEVRVDTKLDEIERRLDEKLIQIHKRLGQLRDREIRHRLRLLKVTLMFTVLVALLSLGYKWLCKYWLVA